MIISCKDGYYLVKIFKETIPDFDIFDIDMIKNLFKDILIKVKDKYNLSGLIDIDVYVNYEYGIILEIYELINYEGAMDVRIHFNIDVLFMCEIDDNNIIDYDDVYYYDNKYYVKYNNLCDSMIIYKGCNDIIDRGIRIIKKEVII